MLSCISKLIIEASSKSLIAVAAQEIETYLSLGIRKELLENVHVKDALYPILSDIDDQGISWRVLEGITYYFINGKALFSKDTEDSSGDEQEEELKNINITQNTWEKGEGPKLEAFLRAQLTSMLIRERLVKYSEMDERLDNLIKRSPKPISPQNTAILEKFKKSISNLIFKHIKNTFEGEKANILRKHKFETIEKPKIDKDIITPVKHNFTTEQIAKWVERWMGKKYLILYENLVWGNPPLSEEELVEKIKKDTGEEVTRRTLNNWKTQMLKEIQERFMEGTKVPKIEEVKNKGLNSVLETMDPENFEDFEKFVEDKLKEANRKDQSEEKKEKIKKYLKELKAGKSLEIISGELEMNISDLKNINTRKLTPWYDEWVKEQESDREACFNLIKMACDNITAEEIKMAESTIDYDKLGMDYDITNIAAIKHLNTGPIDKPKEKKKEEVPEEAPEKEKDKKAPYKKVSPLEKKLETISDKDLKDKSEDKKKFERAFFRSFVKKNNPRRYSITIEFDAKFDWDDIGRGKFNPVMDEDGAFTKDAPDFGWESYSVNIDETLGSRHYFYTYKQELEDNGVNRGPAESVLKVTNTKTNENIISESGEDGFYKEEIDKHFATIRDLGIPVPKGHDLSVRYINTRHHKIYKGTEVFEDKMGGLGISDEAHFNKAKEYKIFTEKKHERNIGPESTGDHSFKRINIIKSLKSISKEPDLTPEQKTKITEYLNTVTTANSENDIPLGIQGEIKKFMDNYYEGLGQAHENVNFFENRSEKEKTKKEVKTNG